MYVCIYAYFSCPTWSTSLNARLFNIYSVSLKIAQWGIYGCSSIILIAAIILNMALWLQLGVLTADYPEQMCGAHSGPARQITFSKMMLIPWVTCQSNISGSSRVYSWMIFSTGLEGAAVSPTKTPSVKNLVLICIPSNKNLSLLLVVW